MPEVKPLTTERRSDDWVVVDPNNRDCPEYGPYNTRADADEDRVGVTKFWRMNKDLLDEDNS